MNKKKSLFIFTGILVFAVLLIALITAIGSGGAAGYIKLPSGLEYKIVENNAKEKVQEGELMIAYITYKTDKDSVVFSTYTTEKRSTVFPVGKAENIGDMNEAFLLLGPKDSALFKLPADSIFKGNVKRPPFAGKGTFIHVGIRVDTVMSKEAFSKIAEEKSLIQKKVDDDLIKEYLTANNLSAKKTASGLYYIIEKNGYGSNAKPGNSISVLYTGKLLDGTVFDASEKNGREPFKVELGTHAVIAGWDEGLTYFNNGSKGILLIPSYLAYGDHEYPGRIPANSVLIFQIEVTNIK